ncbi:UDP-galactose 4-epimerase [Modicisalibacter xianhensis]|uniref:UDP-glucose 4-epimerase n=1 Tax=Modicisalibacter xianhensis TaxID=442341 RepID=A0A4R8FWI3_9GAMM|nr:UDP-glucose 4-epimerase GalE [Halomonas xianhensis]TDX26961.1 UDP-galactose 4-epimerase [Halomonas xianhensis]
MTVLVTGGAGYIGSHTVLTLLGAGHDVVVLDNLCNSSRESLRRIEALAGQAVPFIEGDIRDRACLDRLFALHDIDAVIHFAGLKAVGESMQKPLAYFDSNVSGSLCLFQAMAAAGVYRIVFSSSATVYGEPGTPVFREDMPTGTPTNTYGQTKLMVEQMLQALVGAGGEWSVALLRYFNPVGAHESGQIGEDPQGIPNNLVPFISQVAVGRLESLSVFGDDYPTRDGTGIRDYIHVMDLAEGHLKAMEALANRPGVNVWNLGTGTGYSVLEMVAAYEKACGRPIPYKIAPRRAGDIAEFWADPTKAAEELGWKAERGLEAMMTDTWRWQSRNPQGYRNPQEEVA